MTVDAVIVGSGPGGSTAADVLTAAGWSVAIVEKGRNHLLDPDDLTRPASDYSNDEIKFHSRWFLGPDPLVEPRTFRTSEEDGDRVHVGEVNSVPTTVGGGGTHADGKVPRFMPGDFRLLSDLGPQPGADVADWPVTYDELEPFYADVERSIGVAGLDGANPFAGPRSGPSPCRPAPRCSAPSTRWRRPAAGLPPVCGGDGGQQRPLRRETGLQQLRVLCLLRLPDPCQGRPGGHAHAGHGDGEGGAAGRDVRVADPLRGPAGDRGRPGGGRRHGADSWPPVT